MYYQQDASELIQQLHSHETGLHTEEVSTLRTNVGYNELVSVKPKSLLHIFFQQFMDFLVFILIIAALVSGLLGDMERFFVIAFVITMNAVLGKL